METNYSMDLVEIVYKEGCPRTTLNVVFHKILRTIGCLGFTEIPKMAINFKHVQYLTSISINHSIHYVIT